MRSLRGLSLEDVAYEVSTVFNGINVVAVLVGGGAAAFYAPLALVTRDLDFVLHLELFGAPKGAVLTDLGFVPSNAAGTYRHDETPFTLEILSGPLAIGSDTPARWDTHRKGDLVLHVISPTDSVKDRLAHAIHFHDVNAAKQAAEVARLQSVDLVEIKDWCEREGGHATYLVFESFRIG